MTKPAMFALDNISRNTISKYSKQPVAYSWPPCISSNKHGNLLNLI